MQPNRHFFLNGEVAYLENETEFTMVKLNVFDYSNIQGKGDEIAVWFNGKMKKAVDNSIKAGSAISVMGDIVVKESKIFLVGKAVDVFRSQVRDNAAQSRFVGVDDVNYKRAY